MKKACAGECAGLIETSVCLCRVSLGSKEGLVVLVNVAHLVQSDLLA